MALTKVTAGVIAANAVVDSFGSQSITGDKIGLTAINANNIVTGAVTGDKLGATSINANNIVTGAITGDKLGATSINANNIVNGTITSAKIDTVANTKITGLITTSQLANNLTVNASSIISSANIDFKIGASQNTAFRIEDTGQLYNSIESTTGTDYRSTLYAGYMCRAWVRFNGTGTPAIVASGNISSITDGGTGSYRANFTTNLPDANYATTGMAFHRVGIAPDGYISIGGQQVSYTEVFTTYPSANYYDAEIVCLAVFR